jgi:MscS family membrane protein
VLASVRELLEKNPKVETATIPVRFIGIGTYSLDIEVFAYILTSDFDEYLGIQQDLLLEFMRAVERAGAGLAIPLFESFTPEHLARAS